MAQILNVDARTLANAIPGKSVQCVVTSPPYFGLRDYGVEGQIGLEQTPEQYVAELVDVFRQVRKVLLPDGTLWLNLGDSYTAGNMVPHGGDRANRDQAAMSCLKRSPTSGLKPKDLIGIPWRVALALQADGWYLRSDIIWHKPNPMPESVTDRPTKAHEYLFLLSKNERYYYDADAIKEPVALSTIGRGPVVFGGAKGRCYQPKKGDPNYRAGSEQWGRTFDYQESCVNGRNKRTVWTIATHPYPEAHFATFPEKLVEPCILAGSRPGDTVLDPFAGSGTTLAVAERLSRQAIGVELNQDYCNLIKRRLSNNQLNLII